MTPSDKITILLRKKKHVLGLISLQVVTNKSKKKRTGTGRCGIELTNQYATV